MVLDILIFIIPIHFFLQPLNARLFQVFIIHSYHNIILNIFTLIYLFFSFL